MRPCHGGGSSLSFVNNTVTKITVGMKIKKKNSARNQLNIIVINDFGGAVSSLYEDIMIFLIENLFFCELMSDITYIGLHASTLMSLNSTALILCSRA